MIFKKEITEIKKEGKKENKKRVKKGKGETMKKKQTKCICLEHTERARDLSITTNPPTDNPIGSPRRCIRNCNS